MWQAYLEVASSFSAFAVTALIANSLAGILKSTDKFSLDILWRTNIRPFLWSLASGLLIAAVAIFTPANNIFIESVTGKDVDLENMYYLWSSAVILGELLKAKFAPSVTTVKAQIAANKK